MTGQQQQNRIADDVVRRAVEAADLPALVGRFVALKPNGKEFVGPCPFHKESTPSFTLFRRESGWRYHCFGCKQSGDALGWMLSMEKLSFREAVAKLQRGSGAISAQKNISPAGGVRGKPKSETEDKEKWNKVLLAQDIWNSARGWIGTPVDAYLRARGVRAAALQAEGLRGAPELYHGPTGDKRPALVARVSGEKGFRGVHRTFLRPDGSDKAEAKPAKMMLGICQGCHIRMFPPRERLIVAEGIETALSLRLAFPDVPVWSAMSLNNMDAPVPDTVRELILAADGDNSDQAAAERTLRQAAERHQRPGRVVKIRRPADGMDFNDMVRG